MRGDTWVASCKERLLALAPRLATLRAEQIALDLLDDERSLAIGPLAAAEAWCAGHVPHAVSASRDRRHRARSTTVHPPTAASAAPGAATPGRN